MKKELFYYLCSIVIAPGVVLKESTFDIIKNIKSEGSIQSGPCVLKNAQTVYIKIVSDKVLTISHLSFYREMLEKCIDDKIISISLTFIEQDDYLQQKIETDDETGEDHEVEQCVTQLDEYIEKINIAKPNGVDLDKFSESCNHVIDVLKKLDKSKKVHLEHSDFRYFEFKEYLEGNEVVVSVQEIATDDIK
ncbi:MAG: hypothetical protein U9Q66_00675 [Patescibacteria group bacterium]|nr:hypothetical protein [Patescibacteria group bacterium]